MNHLDITNFQKRIVVLNLLLGWLLSIWCLIQFLSLQNLVWHTKQKTCFLVWAMFLFQNYLLESYSRLLMMMRQSAIIWSCELALPFWWSSKLADVLRWLVSIHPALWRKGLWYDMCYMIGYDIHWIQFEMTWYKKKWGDLKLGHRTIPFTWLPRLLLNKRGVKSGQGDSCQNKPYCQHRLTSEMSFPDN